MNLPPFGDEPARLGFEEALLQHDPAELFDRAPFGYVSTSPDDLIVAVNQTILSWTGYTPANWSATGPSRNYSAPATYYDTHFGPMLAMQGTVREIALELVRPDHGRIPVLVNAVVDFHADSRPKVSSAFLAPPDRAQEGQ